MAILFFVSFSPLFARAFSAFYFGYLPTLLTPASDTTTQHTEPWLGITFFTAKQEPPNGTGGTVRPATGARVAFPLAGLHESATVLASNCYFETPKPHDPNGKLYARTASRLFAATTVFDFHV